MKLLGVYIEYQLNFDQHISNLCRKAGQQLNVLKRLSPFLSRLNKITIFHTFILSNFNYCPLAWHFCSESNSKKLEKIQERALRFDINFMFLFCLVFAMFCARLCICALWSPAGKGLTSWLSFVLSSVSLSLSHWYPGSGVVLDCTVS